MQGRPKNSLTPYVIEDTGRGERSMDIFSRLLQDRLIFLGTEISDQVANVVVAQLLFLRTTDPKKPISLYINSPGGYATAGLAIYDTMQFLECEINTYCIGQATSIAALLLAAGTKGKRYALPNSRIMIHQPMGGVTGQAADISRQAKEVIRLRRRIAESLSTHTGRDLERVLVDSDRDYFMSAEEAKEYGMVDEVVTPRPFGEKK